MLAHSSQMTLAARCCFAQRSRATIGRAVTSKAATAAAASRAPAVAKPLHHVAPEGFSSAWVLPNVPQQYTQLRSALSVLQQQLDRLMRGTSTDRAEGGLLTAALCILVQRAWSKEAAGDTQAPCNAHDTAVTNASRAARFISKATEQAAQQLLSAANGSNTRPDIDWQALPAVLQQHLLDLFQAEGWVTLLGLPVRKQQLPYERPMELEQYHSFISSNPFFIAHWAEDYWVDEITPTPAQHPWLHPLQLQAVLTEDQVLAMSAQLPVWGAVLQAAVDASILPRQLLQEAREAAARAPMTTPELFLWRWVQQAGTAVSAAVAQLMLPVAGRKQQNMRHLASSTIAAGVIAGSSLRPDGQGVEDCVEDRGDGRGGRCYGALTAVGSGDEGDRRGLLASVLPYSDGAQQSDLAGGAEGGLLDAEQHWEWTAAGARCALPTSRQRVV